MIGVNVIVTADWLPSIKFIIRLADVVLVLSMISLPGVLELNSLLLYHNDVNLIPCINHVLLSNKDKFIHHT